MKAGKLIIGEERCLDSIKRKEAKLVILAEDTSKNTKKRIIDKCNFRSINLRVFGSKESLGKYTGTDLRAVVAIVDSNFSTKLIAMIDEEKQKCGGEPDGKNQSL